MLSSSVAQAYLELARAQRLEQVALQAQAQREQLLDLTTQRVDAGLDSKAELRAAESNLEQSAVDIEQARLAAAMARNALAALTGSSAASAPALRRPRSTSSGPARTRRAARRPAAHGGRTCAPRRMRIDAATAGRRAARANFYPNIDLVALRRTVGHRPRRNAAGRLAACGASARPFTCPSSTPAGCRRNTAAPARNSTRPSPATTMRCAGRAGSRRPVVRDCSSYDQQLAAQQRALGAAEQAYDLVSSVSRRLATRSPSSTPKRRCSPPATARQAAGRPHAPRASRCWSRWAATFTQEPAR